MCGAGALEYRSLVPIGGSGTLLAFTPRNGDHDEWDIGERGTLLADPSNAGNFAALRGNRLLAPLGSKFMLDYDQRNSIARVWTADSTVQGNEDPLPQEIVRQTWEQAPGGRLLVTLSERWILDVRPATGNYTVVEFLGQDEAVPFSTAQLIERNEPLFRRGSKLVALNEGRLLAWDPRTSQYHILKYDLDRLPGDVFDSESVVSGIWPDLGREHEIIALSPKRIAIWNRNKGELEVRTLDSSESDPLAGKKLGVTRDDRLRSLPPAWEKPTESKIRRVLIVFQRGRSFDTYFGTYCTARVGSDPECQRGPECCEAMPTALDEHPCVPLAPEGDSYVPDDSLTCLPQKLEAWAQGRLVASEQCGSPNDFVCADTESAKIYRGLASEGALADHYFASFPGPADVNLGLLVSGTVPPNANGASITRLLASSGVPWALYLSDPTELTRAGLPPPDYYDGAWAHFRYVDELFYDIDTEQLPPVSAVVVTGEGSEAPGTSLQTGADFVQQIVDRVAGSQRYEPETLVLVLHIASGFYDHMPPPPVCWGFPLGPRVPFLALGHFALKGQISHVQLDHASLTAFLEWNWLDGIVGQLGHNDGCVNNLGSLLDEETTGGAVPTQTPSQP